MADIIVRGVPDEVVSSLDARASRLGLSRSDYVRRCLVQDTARDDSLVSGVHLAHFADVFGDLGNRDVMLRAWR
jgi:plasmid stability protein